MRYRRILVPGGTYFFTLTLEDRSSNLLVRHVDHLRRVMHTVRARHPFQIIAIAILPDHLHAIFRLPTADANYALRWSLIKSNFSRSLPLQEWIDPARKARRERRIWQRRYWEHLIRDELDLRRHVDYIHYNPVKHGLVLRPVDWQYSSVHRYIEEGRLTADWTGGKEAPAAGESVVLPSSAQPTPPSENVSPRRLR